MSKNLIFIVAYNHEDRIEKVVSRIPQVLLSDPSIEVLIIDDGSKDKTFFAGDRIRRSWNHAAKLTVLKNPVNQGYGGNQKLGYRYAIDMGFDRVFMVHGDGQYAPELLPQLMAEYEKNPRPDAVFGTRMASLKSAREGGMPLYKMLGNRVLTTVQNKILRSGLSEFHSGYRSYSTALLKKIPFEVNSNDFHFDTDIIIQVLAVGGKIVEIPIPTFYGDEVCNVDGFAYARNVIRSSLHYRVHQLGFLYDRKFDVGNGAPPDLAEMELLPNSIHSRIVDRVEPNSRVLYVGFANGPIAQALKDKGCTVDGVGDLDPSEVKSPLRNYYRVNLVRNLAGLEPVIKGNEYDYLILLDILERVPMPEQLLDLIRRARDSHVSPTIVASTGNVGFFVVRAMLMIGQFNYCIRGILDRANSRLFTRKSFHWIFTQCGYAILDTDGVTLPFRAIFKSEGLWVRFLEKVGTGLARFWSSLFAYQFLIEAKPLPTAEQLLKICEDHSNQLRQIENPEARVGAEPAIF